MMLWLLTAVWLTCMLIWSHRYVYRLGFRAGVFSRFATLHQDPRETGQ